jgi:predicted ArsR family transcriptional regulator
MTLKEAILDYLNVCGEASSKELSEVFGVNSAKVLKEMERLRAFGEIIVKGNTAQLATKQLVTAK